MRTFSLLAILFSVVALVSNSMVLVQAQSVAPPDQVQQVYLPLIAAGARSDVANLTWRLTIDPGTGNVTIDADQIRLSTILREFKTAFQIEVIVSDFHDQLVTVNFENTPLPTALAQILPQDVAFYFKTPDLDLTIPGRTGAKVPDPTQISASADLPTKGALAIQSMIDISNVKSAVAVVHLPLSTGEGGKAQPEQISGVIGRGTQIVRPPIFASAQETERYARLVLHIDQSGVQVAKFIEVPGQLLEPTMILGNFFYKAQVNGQTVSIGSVQDPLELRSYGPNGNHTMQRAQTATFVISLPATFLNENNLRSAVIRFFYIEKMEQIAGASVSVETLADLESHLVPAIEISSGELLEAYTQRN